MSGNFLSCSKGVKDPFEVPEGRCDFARQAAAENGLISPGGENHLVFFELQQVPFELLLGPQGPACVASGKACLHARKGPHLAWRGEHPGFSGVVVVSSRVTTEISVTH